MCFIGTGSTFVLSAGDVGRVTSIGGFDEEISDIPDDDLASAGHNEYCPGGRIEHTPIEVGVVFDPNDTTSLGTVVTGTVTFPVQGVESSGATLAGTGFLRKRSLSGLENNERIEGNYEFRFDGKTGPVYTAGS